MKRGCSCQQASSDRKPLVFVDIVASNTASIRLRIFSLHVCVLSVDMVHADATNKNENLFFYLEQITNRKNLHYSGLVDNYCLYPPVRTRKMTRDRLEVPLHFLFTCKVAPASHTYQSKIHRTFLCGKIFVLGILRMNFSIDGKTRYTVSAPAGHTYQSKIHCNFLCGKIFVLEILRMNFSIDAIQ